MRTIIFKTATALMLGTVSLLFAGEKDPPKVREVSPTIKETSKQSEAIVAPTISTRLSTRDDSMITVDVFVAHVSDLKGYQVALSVTDADGKELELASAQIDQSRTDYVFHSLTPFGAVDMRGQGRMAAALFEGSANVKTPKYLGSFTYYSNGSHDDIQVRVKLDEQTMLRNSKSQPIEFVALNVDAKEKDPNPVPAPPPIKKK